MSVAFTCNTCKLEFESSELQRAHMHTDYHGYNLKRKIASLAPISAEIFERNATKAQDEANSTIEGGEAKGPDSLQTQPHRLEIERGYTPARCLFCNIDSSTMGDNLEHMFKVHGMFIPNQEDLEDAEGLLSYLFNIISGFRECLYCGKVKETVEGIRSHMIDKRHCKIAFDEELDQFYDFQGGSEDGAEEEMIREDEEHAEADKASPPRGHDFHPDSDHELRLPSGRTLGHRSLSRYYRQNLHSYPTPTERADRRAIIAAEAADGDHPMPDHPGRQLATRARGEMGMVGVSDFEKRALRATEKKALKQEARARNEHEWRVNKESNHQKHYRPADPGRTNG
ncbi:hypothetical protein HO133_004620 [Letharia lupina]|uniref:C2H2-type domain-containing protein n=1 Tax=Letharia lupina TaxID=560253 RepID=A0A8H6KZT2_9LECA|nr:uncharacterized protein HO133_004620 [Letharia lupina]KAF6230280.1 hypothetical protein HO133_004620 [Letharia lupina]